MVIKRILTPGTDKFVKPTRRSVSSAKPSGRKKPTARVSNQVVDQVKAESARNRAAIFLLEGKVSSVQDKVSSMQRLFDERDETNASVPEPAPSLIARVKKNDMWIDVLVFEVLLLSNVCIWFFHFIYPLVGQ
jgi:hypothetical protein